MYYKVTNETLYNGGSNDIQIGCDLRTRLHATI